MGWFLQSRSDIAEAGGRQRWWWHEIVHKWIFHRWEISSLIRSLAFLSGCAWGRPRQMLAKVRVWWLILEREKASVLPSLPLSKPYALLFFNFVTLRCKSENFALYFRSPAMCTWDDVSGCPWATTSELHGICMFHHHYPAAVIMTSLLAHGFCNSARKAVKGRTKLTQPVRPSSSSSPLLHLFYAPDKLAAELNYFSWSEKRRKKRLSLPQDIIAVSFSQSRGALVC